MLLAAGSLRAASPPSVTVVATGLGTVKGGVAIGSSGRVYIAGIAPNGKGYLRAYDSANQALWFTYLPGTEPPIHAIPTLSPGGESLYIGADDGRCYCVDALSGAVSWSYQVPVGTDRRIRSGVAYDAFAPNGAVVYFQCFNGYLYALSASTGALRWSAITDNGIPPDHSEHLQSEAFTSSPVVGANGTVFVGSTDGYVYAFNAGNGARLWRVNVGRPLEATLAIGSDGWLFAATRTADDSRTPESDVGARVVAINPAKAAQNPYQAIEWEVPDTWGGPGYLASPVIDQGGFVYAAEFHNYVVKLHPKTGATLQAWSPGGKICQTPSLNQDGLLIVGTSTDSWGNPDYRGIRAIHTGKPDSPWWSVGVVNGVEVGDFLGSPAIRCTSSGLTYMADTAGRLYRFNSGAKSMAGDWPTFQSGVRRQGKLFSYSFLIAELPGFYGSGIYSPSLRGVDAFGRASGQAPGYYRYPYGNEWGPSAAVWRALTIKNPTGPINAAYGTYAVSVNGFGDVAGWNGNTRPVVWPDGANVDAPETALALGGFNFGYAADMNAESTIVGYVWNNTATNVFLWPKSGDNWSGEDWGTTPGNIALAYALSDVRRVAGKARFTPGGEWRAYVTTPSALQVEGDLGTLGGLQSEAWDVNDDSGTVGWAHNAAGQRRAFYIQIGGLSLQPVNELPRLAGTTGSTYHSEAYGVNRLGQVVGRCQNDAGAWRAFLYNPGPGNLLTDLSTLPLDGGGTPASQGWTLTDAVAINDGGIIVGHGVKGGSNKAWILYPKCVE
jgi:probable HAF family extracellular repeat protein